MSTNQYGMVIDLRSCTGCQTCVVSCKTSNEVPEDGWWNHLLDYHDGEVYIASAIDGKVSLRFRPTLCNHCENPICVANCPTGAMHKNEETGIVAVDQDVCIGCNTCGKSCPYEVPVLQKEQGVMGKCNLCAGRIDQGKDPFCVQACPTRIRKVGLISDPNSEVSKLIAEHDAQVWQPENGTGPSVYYILPA
ncbi:4Fe-4S dicluster domain-containing protein [Adlercreutzia sp. R25]|uniref:4Fe-4S dicluster domain-containing protein n=1 Tax=Adlercreutzia shanghongiae TaxID=3111773 RepID=A0ABU6IVA0_9ACTN|nr:MULTISPECIES: 4Fe-4S dicluster domain-containing protein [unclassified Adlercreutzia]MEC4272029.1 4Fe-4S dicluster domain-containing protein [Adlercreutzia sp. R25]MEC4293760.1 4Fe-4S dicluster domain-containing protein [Adlercreutzia sp. R22]